MRAISQKYKNIIGHKWNATRIATWLLVNRNGYVYSICEACDVDPEFLMRVCEILNILRSDWELRLPNKDITFRY